MPYKHSSFDYTSYKLPKANILSKCSQSLKPAPRGWLCVSEQEAWQFVQVWKSSALPCLSPDSPACWRCDVGQFDFSKPQFVSFLSPSIPFSLPSSSEHLLSGCSVEEALCEVLDILQWTVQWSMHHRQAIRIKRVTVCWGLSLGLVLNVNSVSSGCSCWFPI